MKNIYDIFEEFKNLEIKTAKRTFSKILKEYIHNQYHGFNEQDDLEKFEVAYTDEMGKKPTNLSNWLNPTHGGISRKSIMEIAFVLNQNKNGETIANNLLQTIGYTRLHATSEREIFYIYALRNGVSYKECQQLHSSYIQDHKIENMIPVTHGTSTSFYYEMKDVTDEEKLFSFVNDRAFGAVSKKINALIASSFENMMSEGYRIVIRSYANKKAINDAKEKEIDIIEEITDGILNALEINPESRKKEKQKILSALKKMNRKVAKDTLTLYICGKENKDSVCNILEKYKGVANIRTLNKSEMRLWFYLFYSSDQSMTEFFQKYEKTPHVNMSGGADTSRERYHYYLETTKTNFYPCKVYFSSVFEALDGVLKNKDSLSREGLLLWLLFYYQRTPEKYYTLHDINAIIGGEKYQRFSLLDEQNYFDRFIIMIAQFKLKDGKVFYGEEEIDTKDLNTCNIHELRHSVLRKFEKYFDSDFAADSFVDTANSTTMRI